MRLTTIATTAGGGLLAAAVLAVTFTAPPGASATAQPLQLRSGVLAGASASPDAVNAASSTPTARPAPAPLTDEQKALVDAYLAAHPGRAQALAATAARWKTFADANPALAAELAKVAAMAPDDRKSALQSWFADHPEQKAAFRDWAEQTRQDRVERREARRDRRQNRREHRQDRRQDRRDGASTTPAPTTSGSGFSVGSSSVARA
jgi:hypothetical protein